ncbi:hypothetical protein [Roseivirga pacifica]|uniref:hypothetical protein n=1 Tax=Roseivirga pacifica TaxID=1267423 RepID=UPI003BAF4F39
MKFLCTLCLFILSISHGLAQIKPGDIEVVDINIFKTSFVKDKKILSSHQLFNFLKNDQHVGPMIKNAYANHRVSNLFKYAGTALITGPFIQSYILNTTPDYTYTYAGIGISILAYIFHQRYKKRAIAAVSLYNNPLPTSDNKRLVLNFEFYGVGTGLTLTF